METSHTHTEEDVVSAPVSAEADLPTISLDAPVPFYKKNKQLVIAIAMAIVLILGAGSYYIYTTQYSKGAVVAVVNGKKIYQKEFNESIALIEQSAIAQGMDITQASAKTEIKNQAIEILVNNALLITAADKSGIEVTDEDVQEKYDELVTQLGGEEALEAKMLEIGLTKDKLKANIEERILADKYIEAETDIENLSVSDEEVNEFLKSLDTTKGDLPPMEQIRPQIESQILGQKQQQLVENLLKKLKEEGKVEVKI